jgi:Bacterial Ig-like domain (group 1)
MRRHLYRVFLCLALIITGVACAPKLVGPTGTSGYFFSLSVSPTQIWLEPSMLMSTERPTFAELLVQVRNAQGQPVDGVPVEFHVEPEWTNSVTLEPPRTTTQGGVAQVIFRARSTGVARVMARVEDTIQETTITISLWSLPGGGGSGS